MQLLRCTMRNDLKQDAARLAYRHRMNLPDINNFLM